MSAKAATERKTPITAEDVMGDLVKGLAALPERPVKTEEICYTDFDGREIQLVRVTREVRIYYQDARVIQHPMSGGIVEEELGDNGSRLMRYPAGSLVPVIADDHSYCQIPDGPAPGLAACIDEHGRYRKNKTGWMCGKKDE